MGLKIGPIRPKRSNAEVTEEGGGVGLKIGPIRPKRSNAEVTEEEG
jgi:hypothetical protein